MKSLVAAVIPLATGTGTHDAVGRGFKELDGLVSGQFVVGGFEDEFADAQGGVGPGDFLEVLPPFVPERRALLKGEFDGLGHFLVLLHDGAEVELGDEFGVAFLLAGDDLVDNHRAARGDGFLNGRAAGLADDEVVAHHQFGHLVRPAEHLHAVAEIAGAFDEFGAQLRVASGDDGEMDVFEIKQAVNGLAGLFPAGVDDIEDTAGFVAGGLGKFASGLSANIGLTGKPSVWMFFSATPPLIKTSAEASLATQK